MPELPEVQTIVNDLQPITGDTITGFWTGFEKAIKSSDFRKKIIGKKIERIERIGKNIVLHLNSNAVILIHLKMTGKLILVGCKMCSVNKLQPNSYNLPPISKHLHHIFYLKNNGELEFYDIRKFATLQILSDEKLLEITNSKGIDPLSSTFTADRLAEIIERNKNKNTKSFLMDQKAISGIGNIYASEIPFEAKISPLRSIGKLQKHEIIALHISILKVLKKAIQMRGTSFSDYRDAKGEKGGFQEKLKVYGKAGKKCSECDTIIAKSVVQQRSTFHCPTCQH